MARDHLPCGVDMGVWVEVGIEVGWFRGRGRPRLVAHVYCSDTAYTVSSYKWLRIGDVGIFTNITNSSPSTHE